MQTTPVKAFSPLKTIKTILKIETLCITRKPSKQKGGQAPLKPPEMDKRKSKGMGALPPNPQGIYDTLGLFLVENEEACIKEKEKPTERITPRVGFMSISDCVRSSAPQPVP